MRLYGIGMLGLLQLGNIAAVVAGYWSFGDSTAVSLVVLVGCLLLTLPEIAGGSRR